MMENISYDDFKKLDLRVGEIKEVEEIAGADRLYKLKVDLGSEERQLVAGIKTHYAKEGLLGRKIVVLANLEPRAIRGITSHGMLLAAATENKVQVTLLALEKDIINGAIIT